MRMINFPELRQFYEWDCGASAVQSLLHYYGLDASGSELVELIGTNKQGSSPVGLKKALKKYGLEYKAGKMTISEVKDCIKDKRPVIMLIQAWPEKRVKANNDWKNSWHNGHYVVAIGYDAKKIYFEDPYVSRRSFLYFSELIDRWHDLGLDGKKYVNWGMVVFGKRNKHFAPIHME